MKNSLQHGPGWPTQLQMLLLRACLLKGDSAMAAWLQWKKETNFDQIDGASFRLVPMLYSNLHQRMADDPRLPQLKGIYRHAWSRNQLLFHEGMKVLIELQQEKIPALLLKGAALVAGHYRDAGLRPMNDFDALVSPDSAPKVFAILQKMGWHYAEPMPIGKIIHASHAAKFDNKRGQQIDLHWYLLPEGRQPRADEEVWKRSVKCELNGKLVDCINPTDLLFHVCAHGVVGDSIPPIRWICDAWKIILTVPIDWERFLRTARDRKLTMAMSKSLLFLRDNFSVPIPDDVVNQMRATPAFWIEKWESKIKSNPRGMSGAIPLHCLNYLRECSDKTMLQKAVGVPSFFQRVWGLRQKREIPTYVARKIWSRVITK